MNDKEANEQEVSAFNCEWMSGLTVTDEETNGQTEGCKMCEYKSAIMITSNWVTTGTLLNSPFLYNHSLFYSTCTLLAWELGPLNCLLLMFQADIPQFPSLNLVLLEIELSQPWNSCNME